LLDATRYVLADVEEALFEIGRESRGEYDTPFPSVGELLDRVEAQRRKRTAGEAQKQCDARLAAYEAYADRIRQEREDEWNRKKGEREKTRQEALGRAG
jgi:hypothetical protein